MLQSSFKNQIIRSLPSAEFSVLSACLEPVEFKARDVVVRANAPVRHVFFPDSGQISVLASAGGADAIEVAMIGREGMTDMISAGRCPMQAVVQYPGSGHRLDAERFDATIWASSALARLVLKFERCLLTQVAFNALSHGRFTVPQRLARWLLMVHDRADHDEVPVAHEFMAWMLGVRRAGITEALAKLRSAGAIRTGRGKIAILSRSKLKEEAAGSYGRPESEYATAFGLPDPSADDFFRPVYASRVNGSAGEARGVQL